MVISKQLCILTLFTHLAVIASGETDQTIGREAEPGADPATISGSLYLDPWQIEKDCGGRAGNELPEALKVS